MTPLNPSPIQRLLESLGLIRPETIEEYYPRVRDREDIRVLRCRNSGVIFLAHSHPEIDSNYASRSDFAYWQADSRQHAVQETFDDDTRRARQFEPLIRGKTWLDFGTGAGGILDLLGHRARETWAVELQEGPRTALIKDGYRVESTPDRLPDRHFEIITLFHVLEHLLEPVELLRQLHRKLAPGGKIIVEVPHARDFLLSVLESEAFKAFTFWSEHLVLHTRESLRVFLTEGGFQSVQIQGFQRYPLANHLFWLARQKPGGHRQWQALQAEDIDGAYSGLLNRLDATDTLIAFAEKSHD